MNTATRIFTYSFCITVLSLGFVNTAFATMLNVTVDTISRGSISALYFDFVGNGSPTNTSTITSFTTDGLLGAVTTSGNVTGNLPGTVTLDTTSFFNELAQNIKYGTQFSFDLNVTENTPSLGGTPDAFSLFLADNRGNTFPTTTDPTGSNALFLFNVDGTSSGNLNLYSSTDLPVNWQVTPAAIPIPSVIWLFASGFMGILLNRKKVPTV